MSYSIDANILLYASDESSPHHPRARAFLADCAESRELLCLAWPTVMAYLRISTHPAILAHPLAPRDAERNIDSLLSLPQVRAIGEEPGFWGVYQEAAGEFPVRGNLVPDAHVASLLLQHEVRVLYTADADFRKFPFLRVGNPLV